MEINFEKFMADYNAAVESRNAIVAEKDSFIAEKKAQIEQLSAPLGLSDAGKDRLLEEVLNENKDKFDVEKANEVVANFEKYIVFETVANDVEVAQEIRAEESECPQESVESNFPEQSF